MKNLIFVAVLVSVMLVLGVGTAFAAGDDGYYPADKNAEAGSGSSGVTVGEGSGESSGGFLTVSSDVARYDDAALSLRGIE
jgi:hypothetical protein